MLVPVKSAQLNRRGVSSRLGVINYANRIFHQVKQGNRFNHAKKRDRLGKNVGAKRRSQRRRDWDAVTLNTSGYFRRFPYIGLFQQNKEIVEE